MLITSNYSINIEKVHPYRAQIVSFITLSLPTFLYFYLSEISKNRGTIGKRLMKIYVEISHNKPPKRNIFKFLPWEFAHAGMHWMGYYGFDNPELPMWIWALIIIPEVIALSYIISAIYYKGSKTLYDIASNTLIARR
ncbi:RDD family protein [Changchengzhania lutea]|uniref:RDD family protein n=1 Tax=Changchengzhania lutea TaxID=2049305 RepID=UPI00115D2867|nr:RDD family protein [Changchengzhania lutea]